MKRPISKKSFSILSLGSFWLLFILWHLEPQRSYLSFGTLDFIEYWSAFQVFAAGGNPYNPASLLAVQQEIGRADVTPLMMWNPPWNLLLLDPILRFNWPTSVTLWILANIALLLVSTAICFQTFRDRPISFSTLILSCATYFPTLYCIEVGQLSIVLYFSCTVVFYGAIRNRPLVAGLGLAGLTLKPHLLYLVILFLAWHYCRARNWRALAAFAVPSILVVGLTVLLIPTVLSQWLWALQHPDPVLIPNPVNEWLVPTIPSMIRIIIEQTLNRFSFAPSIAVPLLSALGLLIFCIRKRHPIPLSTFLPLVLFLDLITTPYAWIFDFSLLLPLHLFALDRCLAGNSPKSRRVILGIFATQILAFVWSRHPLAEHHHFIWLPFLIWFWYWHGERIKHLSPNYSSNIPPGRLGGGGISSPSTEC